MTLKTAQKPTHPMVHGTAVHLPVPIWESLDPKRSPGGRLWSCLPRAAQSTLLDGRLVRRKTWVTRSPPTETDFGVGG